MVCTPHPKLAKEKTTDFQFHIDGVFQYMILSAIITKILVVKLTLTLLEK